MKSIQETKIWKFSSTAQENQSVQATVPLDPVADYLAVEEPLEIQLSMGPAEAREQRSISITMRTPGHDAELALGFLYTEGILKQASDVLRVAHLPSFDPSAAENRIQVELSENAQPEVDRLERHFYTSSSCGVCGKTSIEALAMVRKPVIPAAAPKVSADLLLRLPELQRQQQEVFASTGGLHAAALFDAQGQLKLIREDVGRHNALDKLIGAAFRNGLLPLHDHLLLLSGRASFELIQKALMAEIPIIAAVGAPSSLAVQLAEEYGISLAGFVRNGQFNLYCGRERLI